MQTSAYLDALVKELSRLPGIGAKSASRLAFHILRMKDSQVRSLVTALTDLKEHIMTCSRCGGISDSSLCSICTDEKRDRSLLCVVEGPRDILFIEAAGEFKGLYHVLNGLISPLDGIGPGDLNLKDLEDRCRDDSVKEVILALNSTIEGDATAAWLSVMLEKTGVLVTRIARGLPVGSDLEYADSATIAQSFEGRVMLSSGKNV